MFHEIWCSGIAILVLVTVIEDQRHRWLCCCWFYLVELFYPPGPETRDSFDQRYCGINCFIKMQFDIQTINSCWDVRILLNGFLLQSCIVAWVANDYYSRTSCINLWTVTLATIDQEENSNCLAQFYHI